MVGRGWPYMMLCEMFLWPLQKMRDFMSHKNEPMSFYPFPYNFRVCRNLNLGLTTKARVCKGAGQDWAHFIIPGMQKSVREWTLTLPSELPFWELESQWTPKFLEGNWRGQNSLAWGVFYISKKLFELRCSKWACMTHLSSWNKSYGKKKAGN
jgi:hypothetical protein